jgi:molybdopterin molybdotransferase
MKYKEALAAVLENIQVLDVEDKPIFQCIGQVAAEDVFSEYDLPMTDISGPDGYAVRAEDISGASRENPVILRIIGTVRAGFLPKRKITSGTTMRIMTGSTVPEGADCVVRFEDTDEPGNKNGPNRNNPSKVKLYLSEKPGNNIRPAGANVKKGSLVLPSGTVIGPAQVSVLAAVGKTSIKVTRRPIIAIIATGDELISLNRPLSPGKSYNCNTEALKALITHYGGIPLVLGIARDNEASLHTRMQKGLTADALITSGGVSKGDYDLVRLVIGKIGQVIFSRINMGPGASFALGLVKRNSSVNDSKTIPVFALSGPPAGCLNNFELLVRPAMLKMMGYTRLEHSEIEAIAGDPISTGPLMSTVKWAKLDKVQGEYKVDFNVSEKIGSLAAMSTCNSLMIIPEGTDIKKGEKVEILPLDWSQGYRI